MRKRGQYTCRCEAYHFPHRIFGGKCTGINIVKSSFPGSECKNCLLLNDGCEVIKGQEHPRECVYVQNLIHFHEV